MACKTPVKYPYTLAAYKAACLFLKETNLIPRGTQASAASITGMATLPKMILTSLDFSMCVTRSMPVWIGRTLSLLLIGFLIFPEALRGTVGERRGHEVRLGLSLCSLWWVDSFCTFEGDQDQRKYHHPRQPRENLPLYRP